MHSASFSPRSSCGCRAWFTGDLRQGRLEEKTHLTQLNARAAREAIRSGEIASEQLVGASLDRIAEVEETVQAWTYLDADYAMDQARAADQARRQGRPLGPLHGLISRHGVLRQSRPLDQIGVFARSPEDAAILAEQLMAFDERDPDMRPRARPTLVQTVGQEPPVTPRLAFVRSPVWDQAEAATQDAFVRLAETLGDNVTDVRLPEVFDRAVAWHGTIMLADFAKSFAREYESGAERLSAALRDMIERGQSCLAVDYNLAVERRFELVAALDEIFADYDAILTPAATGEAPLGLEATGSPIFCTLWTLCGVPAITLPLLQGEDGMPLGVQLVGVQLVGAKGDDARLLRTARWLVETRDLPGADPLVD